MPMPTPTRPPKRAPPPRSRLLVLGSSFLPSLVLENMSASRPLLAFCVGAGSGRFKAGASLSLDLHQVGAQLLFANLTFLLTYSTTSPASPGGREFDRVLLESAVQSASQYRSIPFPGPEAETGGVHESGGSGSIRLCPAGYGGGTAALIGVAKNSKNARDGHEGLLKRYCVWIRGPRDMLNVIIEKKKSESEWIGKKRGTSTFDMGPRRRKRRVGA
ncbi:hypothetical protein B0H13DRAFT_1922922 [Mycena leptocephala]|nr:hypothetical protein B0H13DRAFT_1922922 [Mycena leptocephala]